MTNAISDSREIYWNLQENMDETWEPIGMKFSSQGAADFAFKFMSRPKDFRVVKVDIRTVISAESSCD